MSHSLILRCVATLALLLCGAARDLAAEPLPMLNVDLAQTTVSGLSSGAYMAGQFHIAYLGPGDRRRDRSRRSLRLRRGTAGGCP